MSTHKTIDEQTLDNLLYLSRLSPESTNLSILKKQVDDIVGYFEILSKFHHKSRKHFSVAKNLYKPMPFFLKQFVYYFYTLPVYNT